LPPGWLTIIAWISLVAAAVSAGAIVYDIYGRGVRQHVRVMEAVWPITALFLGPLGRLAYTRIGRPRVVSRAEPAYAQEPPEWHGVFISATHCGAGCALGDLIAEWVVFAAALTIAGVTLWPEYLIDFTLAYAFGIVFQYYAIKPMSDLSARQAIADAMKAETLSIIAFELGMFAWMALVYFVLFTDPHLNADHAAYWLMMQIAASIGLATSYPVNLWLVRRGIKHAMQRPTLPALAGP
jgi:Domain of unknown function (DUF4396)